MGNINRKNEMRRNQILRTLLDFGQQSLMDLKVHTGISLPLLTTLVTELKDEGQIVDAGEYSPGQAGRPAALVSLNGEAGYILGMDIGRRTTNYMLIDLRQNIVMDISSVSMDLYDTNLIDKQFEITNSLLQNAGVTWDQVLGIGIAVPKVNHNLTGLPQENYLFSSPAEIAGLQHKFGKPVVIEQDARACATGELIFGLARERKNVLCVNLGYRLGLGIIINGEIYRGSENSAGEFGHVKIKPGGRMCFCGKRGCLEAYASGRALEQQAVQKLKQGRESLLTKLSGDPAKITSRMIISAANRGDQFSIEILDEMASALGFGIAQIINLFNPEMIIFGGWIVAMENYIVNTISASAIKHSHNDLNRNVLFTVSSIGDRAGALGAAMLAARSLFDFEPEETTGE